MLVYNFVCVTLLLYILQSSAACFEHMWHCVSSPAHLIQLFQFVQFFVLIYILFIDCSVFFIIFINCNGALL